MTADTVMALVLGAAGGLGCLCCWLSDRHAWNRGICRISGRPWVEGADRGLQPKRYALGYRVYARGALQRGVEARNGDCWSLPAIHITVTLNRGVIVLAPAKETLWLE